MSSKTTWKPPTEHGKLTRQSDLPDSVRLSEAPQGAPDRRKPGPERACALRSGARRFRSGRDLAFENLKKRRSIMALRLVRAIGANWASILPAGRH
jgi:hypothetical protein